MKISKDQLNRFIFYISYSLIVMQYMFSYVNIVGDILKKLSYPVIGLLVFKLIIQSKKYKKREILILFFIIIVSVVVTFFSRDIEIIRIVLLVCTAINIDFQKLVKFDFKLKLTSTIIIITCYYLKLTDVFYMYRADGTIRSSMGFSHPNIFGAFIFSIVCDYIYLKKKKINILDTILICFVSFIVSYYSSSRTSQIGIIIILLGSWLVKLDKIKILDSRIVKQFIRNSFFIFAFFSFLIGYLYTQNNYIAKELNEDTSGRINYIAEFFDEYDITLFGQEIEIVGTSISQTTGEDAWILDNAYSMVLLRYGLITFILMGVYLNIFFNFAYKKNNKYIIINMFVFLIIGFFETNMYKIYFNIFWLYFANLLYIKNIKNKKLEEKSYEL